MNKAAPLLFLALLLPVFRAGAASEPAGGTAIAGFAFRAPDEWRALSTDDAPLTRLADWAAPGGVEVVVFRFGNQPGDVQANLNRWGASVTTPQGTPVAARISTRRIDAYPLTQIEAFGTYLAPDSAAPGLPPSALPGFGLVGAVLELPNGPLYIRLTGPDAAVRKALPGLARFLESARPPPVPRS